MRGLKRFEALGNCDSRARLPPIFFLPLLPKLREKGIGGMRGLSPKVGGGVSTPDIKKTNLSPFREGETITG